MRLDHSLFESQTSDKIVHKEIGEIKINISDTLKVGKLTLNSQKNVGKLKNYNILLTNKRLYYVKNLDHQDPKTYIVKYKAYIDIEWLQSVFYTKKGNSDTQVSYFFEIVRQKKAVVFMCSDLSDYESWVRNLSSITIQTNFHVKYDLKDKMGEGATCTVFNVVDKGSKKIYAAKRIEKKNLKYKKDLWGVTNEISILRLLKGHLNIVELEEVQETEESIYLILENLEGGRVTLTNKKYSVNDIKILATSLLNALVRIHELGIVHRDLKPGNILLKYKDKPFAQNVIKVIDFGISIHQDVEEDFYRNCGTIGYLPPEAFIRSNRAVPNPKSDIYTLGIILYNAFYGMRLFYRSEESEAFRANRKADIHFSSEFTREIPINRKLKSKVFFERFIAQRP